MKILYNQKMLQSGFDKFVNCFLDGFPVRGMILDHQAIDGETTSDAQIDAVSSATLQTGSHSFVWDLTDDEGNIVPAGNYTVKLEGTLFRSSNVVYSGTVDTKNDKPGEIEVHEERSEPDNTDNEDMIQNVRMTERGADND